LGCSPRSPGPGPRLLIPSPRRGPNFLPQAVADCTVVTGHPCCSPSFSSAKSIPLSRTPGVPSVLCCPGALPVGECRHPRPIRPSQTHQPRLPILNRSRARRQAFPPYSFKRGSSARLCGLRPAYIRLISRPHSKQIKFRFFTQPRLVHPWCKTCCQTKDI